MNTPLLTNERGPKIRAMPVAMEPVVSAADRQNAMRAARLARFDPESSAEVAVHLPTGSLVPAPSQPQVLLRDISGQSHNSFESNEGPADRNIQAIVRQLSSPLTNRKAGNLKSATEEVIGELVADVLADNGWGGVDRTTIHVKNVSGHGGSQTYKVTCDGATPCCVALHSRAEGIDLSTISGKRMAAAALLFAQHDLSPRRLAEGGDWIIEEWGGTVLNALSGFRRTVKKIWGQVGMKCADPEEVAKLLAKIHALPIDWYDEWRAALKQDCPTLRWMPDNSPIWGFFTAHPSLYKEVKSLTENQMKTWSEKTPVMTSPHARKLVTCHGDFHLHNMVRDLNGKIRVIDLEATCVTSAVQDLSWGLRLWLYGSGNLKNRRVFVETYLRESGLQATPAEVDEFLFDCEVWQVCLIIFGILFQAVKDEDFTHFNKVLARVERARTDLAERDRILKNGLLTPPWWEKLFWEMVKSCCCFMICIPLAIAPLVAVVLILWIMHV